jgi:hypothetical protein
MKDNINMGEDVGFECTGRIYAMQNMYQYPFLVNMVMKLWVLI